MRRRTIPGLLFTSAAVISLVAPAAATEAPVTHVQTVYEAVQVARPDGTYASRTVATETVVTGKAKSKVLSQRTMSWDNPRFRTMAAGNFFCAGEGHRTGFRQHEVREAINQGKNDFVHFLFFPFSLNGARIDANNRYRQQWLICAAGGADSDNGSRLELSGPGVAYRNAEVTTKIGHMWREGRTPHDYEINLGFEVSRDPVTVKAGITQKPHDSLKGSPVGPFNADVRKYKRNAANGWWEADCWKNECVGTGGSSDYQGSTVEGLYEFPDWAPVTPNDFAYVGWVEHFCSNPFGCSP